MQGRDVMEGEGEEGREGRERCMGEAGGRMHGREGGEALDNGGGGKSWREGRDGGGGTCEAHSPGLVVARVRSWVLAVVRGRSSLFAGVRFR